MGYCSALYRATVRSARSCAWCRRWIGARLARLLPPCFSRKFRLRASVVSATSLFATWQFGVVRLSFTFHVGVCSDGITLTMHRGTESLNNPQAAPLACDVKRETPRPVKDREKAPGNKSLAGRAPFSQRASLKLTTYSSPKTKLACRAGSLRRRFVGKLGCSPRVGR